MQTFNIHQTAVRETKEKELKAEGETFLSSYYHPHLDPPPSRGREFFAPSIILPSPGGRGMGGG
jgi:hypothetical protein